MTADIAKHRGMRRAQLIPVVATSFLLSQLVGLRVQHIEHLQYAALLVGMSYGETFALLTIVIIEWFGMGLYTFLCLLLKPEELTFLRIPSPRLGEHWLFCLISPCNGKHLFDDLWADIRCTFITY